MAAERDGGRARAGRSAASIRLRRLRIAWLRMSDPLLGPLRRRWRRSMMLRIMVTTGAITMLMVVIAGMFILTSTSSSLFEARKDRALQDSARATYSAQQVIDTSPTADSGALAQTNRTVRSRLGTTSESDMFWVRRQPGQPASASAPTDYYNERRITELLSPELSDALAEGDHAQYWQPVQLDASGRAGIIVGTRLEFPAGAGTYDVLFVYDLSDSQATLGFMQRTLALTAIVLLAFIGGLVLVMMRMAFRPIRVAADTSRRLAEGENAARMPPQEDEHFDTLSANFNEMADTLQARISELDRLSEMQQRFVSDVSHELRTPLTTIRLAAEVLHSQTALAAEPAEPGRLRAAEVLRDQVERFEVLLGDLLEISRYDAGRVTLETEPTNLVNLCTEVVDGLQPLSPSLIEVRPLGGYTPLDVDARRIRRIVSNLVANAIEHGEGRPIVVSIDSNAAAIAVGVRDWGIGMTADEASRVFDRFWRADPSRKRTLGGNGLGLAIAKEDAAVHGGLLEVWSRPGEGTNFRLTLPREEGSKGFMSPLPLVPDDVTPAEGDPEATGGWLKRVRRSVRKERGGA